MESLSAMLRHPTMAFPPLPQRQSLFPIDSFHQVFADFPALAVQQHADLPVSVPHSRLSDLADAHSKSGPRIFVAAI